jgi:hypothetical protein
MRSARFEPIHLDSNGSLHCHNGPNETKHIHPWRFDQEKKAIRALG